MSLVDENGWDDASILMPIDPSTEIFPSKLCRCFYLSSVQTCLKQIYQGVDLWCLREKKIAWRENSRKSFTKEPRKICATKPPQKYTPHITVLRESAAKVNNNKDVPTKAARKQFFRLTNWSSVFEHCLLTWAVSKNPPWKECAKVKSRKQRRKQNLYILEILVWTHSKTIFNCEIISGQFSAKGSAKGPAKAYKD